MIQEHEGLVITQTPELVFDFNITTSQSQPRQCAFKRDQTTTSGERISIQEKTMKSEDSVKLLGIQLDYKLNFDPHISALCKKAATQLNVVKRLRALFWF